MENTKILIKIIAGLVMITLLSTGVLMAQNVEWGKAAFTVAEKWLALIDKGNYAASWKEAAEIFRAELKQERWEQLLWAMREPLGKVLSRKKKSANYNTSLPGAPDAEYFVIQFETSFENKKSTIETVVAVMGKDGAWRVSGYGIK